MIYALKYMFHDTIYSLEPMRWVFSFLYIELYH